MNHWLRGGHPERSFSRPTGQRKVVEIWCIFFKVLYILPIHPDVCSHISAQIIHIAFLPHIYPLYSTLQVVPTYMQDSAWFCWYPFECYKRKGRRNWDDERHGNHLAVGFLFISLESRQILTMGGWQTKRCQCSNYGILDTLWGFGFFSSNRTSSWTLWIHCPIILSHWWRQNLQEPKSVGLLM